MTYPMDGKPRFILASNGSAVLDRAFLHRVVEDFHKRVTDPHGEEAFISDRFTKARATKRCAELNAEFP